MMASRLIRPATGSLAWRGLLVLLLAGGAVAQLLLPSSLPLPPRTGATAHATSGTTVATPPSTFYAAIAEHPLFDPTRSPYVAPKPAAPPAAPALSPLREYTLLGIVIGNGARVAFLKPPADGKTVIATEGQAIDGWTLRRITPGRLRFENGAAGYDMRFAGTRWLDP
jgi:hypothetical protein